MARTDPQINVRLPIELKERLGVEARANTRTLNAEIVNRLERSFAAGQVSGLSDDAVTAILETRAMVGQLLDLKLPPDAPFPFHRKKTV